MECCLKSGIIGSVLVRRVAGQDGRDVKQDRRFLKGKRVLGCRLLREGIIPTLNSKKRELVSCPVNTTLTIPCLPRKRYFDMILIDGESKIQQLQLSIVSI